MSTNVVGIIPPDADYKAKLKAWHACKDAGVEPPDALSEFFGDAEPEPKGIVIPLLRPKSPCVTECSPHDSASGFDIDLSKLPPNVKILRFYNSW